MMAFQVFKVDFSYNTLNYSSTTLTMGFCSSFLMNKIESTSTRNAYDFYFTKKNEKLN